jgi:hypothetical protein
VGRREVSASDGEHEPVRDPHNADDGAVAEHDVATLIEVA